MNKKYLCCSALILFALNLFGQIDYQLYNKGISLKNQGEHLKAISLFGKFVQQYPSEHPDVYFQRGYSFFYLKKYKNAIVDFKKSMELDATNYEVAYALGRTYVQLKNNEAAHTSFTKALQLNPNHAPSCNDRGMVACQMRDFENALEDFYRATALDSTFAMAYNNAGAARYYSQDIAKPSEKDLRIAKEWFTKAIAQDPTLALAYRNRATMYILLKNYESAMLDLNKATRYEPNDAMTLFYLGVVYADQSKLQLAINAFQQTLQLNPNLSFAYEEMGNLFKATKQFDRAIENYKLAKRGMSRLYHGLIDHRIALVYAEAQNETKMYDYLKSARQENAYHDRQVYNDFIKAKEFQPYRLDKSFRRFTKSLFKIKKDNKFLNPELGWFRMRK